ncbi:hypothetical protein [Evansella clarkii]|uniref:hypothetical protein n=1 Tax=Evansella clarkii TaxID=79879 RepID=UPI00147296C2|nr:hypothetical protein [Evansella clarkii]
MLEGFGIQKVDQVVIYAEIVNLISLALQIPLILVDVIEGQKYLEDMYFVLAGVQLTINKY